MSNMSKEEIYDWLVDVLVTYEENEEESIQMLQFLTKKLKEEIKHG